MEKSHQLVKNNLKDDIAEQFYDIRPINICLKYDDIRKC